MKKQSKAQNTETAVFRLPKTAIKSVDRLAKLVGSNRSEALRRLIPDLSKKKKGVER